MLSALAEYVRISKYALHVDGRRESREEGIERVMGMHSGFYGARLDPVRDDFEAARAAMLAGEVLGSQRAQQFGGVPILRKHARINNCALQHVNRPRAFQETFWLLLCGCGVGFSVQHRHVSRLPAIRKPKGVPRVYRIPDTIEGWADSLGVLLSSYFLADHPFPEWAGVPVIFDSSLVRPKGAPLSSGSRAPGPEPLVRALELARRRLDAVAPSGALRPIDAYDLLMFAADAVLAGGVRRSATIALFSPEDQEMVLAKGYPGWLEEHPQRQRSNNSAALLRGQTDFADFRALVERARGWGEPGFVWVDDLDLVVNPCVEVGAFPGIDVDSLDVLVDEVPDGAQSGVTHNADGSITLPGIIFCNLSTVNGAKVVDAASFIRAAGHAAFLGTLQAGYTEFPYLGSVTEAITRREALLGVSVTGMSDRPDVLFDPAVLEAGAAAVRETNERVARVIGINPAARCTALKPEGTGTLTLGTLAAGVHPWHSKRGIRHVRASVLETPFQFYAFHNPGAVSELPESDPNRDNTKVLAFAYEAPEGAATKDDVPAMELLRRVQVVRRHWVEPGTRIERCLRPWLRHNVSNTIHVEDHEWDEVAAHVFAHRDDFAGVSLMPASGDKVYALAPYVEVLDHDEQVERHGAQAVAEAELFATLVTLAGLDPWVMVEDLAAHRTRVDWAASRDGLQAWTRLCTEVGGDLVRAGEVVKDVVLWRRWRELVETTVEVDWSLMREAEDLVDFGAEAACGGGSCSLEGPTSPSMLTTGGTAK